MKSGNKRPLEEVDDEAVEDVYQLVAQAEGALRSALRELDGDGEEVRDKLAEAYGATGWSKTALEGENKIRKQNE